MEDQDGSSGQTEVGLETNNAAFLEDAAQNADLHILTLPAFGRI